MIARENVGTEAQPVYQVRYEATVFPTEPLYQQRAHILNSYVLEPVQKKGERWDAFRAFNAEANTRLQNHRQSIETHHRNQLTPISEKGAAARQQHRDAIQAATQHYRELKWGQTKFTP